MKAYTLTFCIFSLVYTVAAQHTKQYSDEFGKKGEIRTSQPFSDTLLPREGRFELRWRAVDSTVIQTYYATGITRQHVPHGRWRWEEASWTYGIVPGTSIRPAFETRGLRTLWEIGFQQGVPHGKWTVTRDSIDENGKSGTPLLQFAMTYTNGLPTGVFTLEKKSNGTHFSVKGNLDKYGRAHGTWQYLYGANEAHATKEDRIYQSGLLLEVRQTINGEVSVKTFPTNQAFFAGNPLNGSRIGTLHFTQDEWGQQAGEMTNQLFEQLIEQGWEHAHFPFSFMRRRPIFVQLEFPLSEGELSYKADAKQKLHQIQLKLAQRLEENMLIHRTRGEQFDLAVSYLEATAHRMNIVDSLLARTDSPLFTYKNRHERGLLHWCSSIDGMREVSGSVYTAITDQLPEMGKVTDESTIFHLLHALLLKTDDAIHPYLELLDAARIALRREGELQVLQNDLVERYERVQKAYQETTGTAGWIYERWVKGEAQQLLQEYARTDSYEDALVLGNQLNNRMDSLLRWRDLCNRADSMQLLLSNQYRYLAYNPYTGINDIEVRLKRRFLITVQTVLWPWLKTELTESADWYAFTENWQQQFRTFNFLMNFAYREDKQADRLQKRIRKEKKPERIWRWLQPFVEEERSQSMKK